MSCPDETQVAAFVDHTLSDADRDAIEQHVYDCDICREALAAAVAITGAPRTIGRYRLDRMLGSGGMGIVWDAWDPALERRIAVKLLRPDIAAGDKLMREARALAALQHPNVVAVYDVGEVDGDVFIATELVDGEPIGQWQLGRAHAEILAAYVQAARGLAAAHRAGLVHRDIKPSNILVSRDGRVRVGDFGLATRASDTDGQIVGTPAYMAPEQRDGKLVDARADQYSLSLSLAEALTGKRSAPVEWPSVARGMAADPAARFATIDQWIAALNPPSTRRYAISGALAGTVAVIAFWAIGPREQPDCSVPLALRKDAITSAFHATKLPYADDAARTTTDALDSYAVSFLAEDKRVCATDGACLTRIRGQVAQLQSALTEHPDPLTIQRAAASARALPDPTLCKIAAMPADPVLAMRVQLMSARLSNAAMLRRLGKIKQARVLAESVVAEAKDLPPALAEALHELGTILHAQNEPSAEKALVDGLAAAAAAHMDLEAAQISALLVEVVGNKGDVAAAERQAAIARPAIIRAGNDKYLEAVVERGLGYANQEANKRQASFDHYKKAEELHRALGMIDDVTFDRRAQVTALGSLDRIDEATKINDDVLAFDREHLGATHPKTVSDIAAKGQLQFRAGHLAESAKAFETAVQLDAQLDGADSVHNAQLRGQLGGVYMTMGKIAESEQLFRDTVRVLAAHVPADDYELRGERMNLGAVLLLLGHYKEAIAELDQLVAAARQAKDDDSLGLTLETLAEAQIGDGQFAAAQAASTEALALAAKVYGPSSRRGAEALTTLGNAYAKSGQSAKATAQFEAAIHMYETSVDKNSQELGESLTGLAELTKDPARAKPLLERAVKLRESSDPVDLAASKFALGRVLFALNDPNAKAEVTAAIELWRGAGERANDRRVAAETWLARQ